MKELTRVAPWILLFCLAALLDLPCDAQSGKQLSQNRQLPSAPEPNPDVGSGTQLSFATKSPAPMSEISAPQAGSGNSAQQGITPGSPSVGSLPLLNIRSTVRPDRPNFQLLTETSRLSPRMKAAASGRVRSPHLDCWNTLGPG
jgi:hypothetical protein